MTRYDAYDRFADVYNRHWGGFARLVVAPLEKLGLSDVDEGSHIVDVCCGTGQLAALLTERGFRVTGVDGSAEMVAIARENAPAAEFLVADAREFTIGSPAQMAVATFDSLNHVMDLDGLTQAFRRVAGVLEPGGRFVFDLNMDEGFRSRWQGTSVIDEAGELIVAESSYDAEERIGSVKLIMFAQSDGSWMRQDLLLTQRAYPEPDVVDALQSVGFTDVSVTDAAEIMSYWQSGRSFFSASLPG